MKMKESPSSEDESAKVSETAPNTICNNQTLYLRLLFDPFWIFLAFINVRTLFLLFC